MSKQILKIFSLLALFFMLPSLASADDKLLQLSDLTYVGAFRMPTGAGGFDYSQGVITYDGESNSLFIVGASNAPTSTSNNYVAQISIPSNLVNSSDYTQLPTSTMLQNFADITEGNQFLIGANGAVHGITNGVHIGGLLEYEIAGTNELIGSLYSYYDGSHTAIRSHFTSGISLATIGDFRGVYKVGATPSPVPQAGFIGGYMANIPLSWQSLLGGPVLSGKSGIPIISRTSYGPAAFAFDPANLVGTPNDLDPVSAASLLYYDQSHQTLGEWSTSEPINQYISLGDNQSGVVFPEGSKSVLFFGRHGSQNCYGPGTTIVAQIGNGFGTQSGTADNQCQGGPVDVADQRCCFEHVDSIYNKGTHSYPYHPYVWAYSADDFASVKSGIKQPWEILPYGTWELNLPTTAYQGIERDIQIKGAAYDPVTQRIYVTQGNFEGNGRKPLIHAFQLSLPSAIDAIPPAVPIGLCVQ